MSAVAKAGFWWRRYGARVGPVRGQRRQRRHECAGLSTAWILECSQFASFLDHTKKGFYGDPVSVCLCQGESCATHFWTAHKEDFPWRTVVDPARSVVVLRAAYLE